jgi:hypothetical protein
MSEQLFKVVFSGELTGDYNEANTRKRFSALFNIDEERTNALFSSKDTVMRSNISKDVALKLMFKLAEAGCDSYLEEIQQEAVEEEVESVAEEDGPPGGEERRKPRERRLHHRRDPRPGAIVPDRRLTIRRRKDLQQFHTLNESNTLLPLSLRSYTKTTLK